MKLDSVSISLHIFGLKGNGKEEKTHFGAICLQAIYCFHFLIALIFLCNCS